MKITTKTQLINRLDKAGMPYFTFQLKGTEEVYTYVYIKTAKGNPGLYKFDKDLKLIDETMNRSRIVATYKAFKKTV